MRENLARALNITPEKLDAARWQARLVTLEDVVEEDLINVDQAARILDDELLKRRTNTNLT